MSDPTAQQARRDNMKAIIGTVLMLSVAVGLIVAIYLSFSGDGKTTTASQPTATSTSAAPTAEATTDPEPTATDTESPTAEATTTELTPEPTATKQSRPALPELRLTNKPRTENCGNTGTGHIERVQQGERIVEKGDKIDGDIDLVIHTVWSCLPADDQVTPIEVDKTDNGYYLGGSVFIDQGRYTFNSTEVGGAGTRAHPVTTKVTILIISAPAKGRCLTAFDNAKDGYLAKMPRGCHINAAFRVVSIRNGSTKP